MPYVIRNLEGKFLRRVKGSYATKRRWTDKIHEATTWSHSGHAINAAHCAVRRATDLYLQEVMLTPKAGWTHFKAKPVC